MTATRQIQLKRAVNQFASALSEDARVTTKDSAQFRAPHEYVRMREQQTTAGEHPMTLLGSGGEPASATPSDADHNAHHPKN